MKSEKNKYSVRLLPVIMAILLLLCGCGANTNQIPYETIPEGKTIPREKNTASNECFQIDMEEDSSNVEEVFRNQVCGVYTYEPDDAEEKRYFEISHMDGQFYLEYIGQYDYAGAELEILNMDIKNSSSNSKRIDFEVMIYPFSGFSFEGEYWGTGNKAIVTKWADENLQLSEGQPFFSGECTKDNTGQVRVYDGVARGPQKRWIGLEVKSGTAQKKRAQREFDNRIGKNNPARGFGRSKNIEIHHIITIRR